MTAASLVAHCGVWENTIRACSSKTRRAGRDVSEDILIVVVVELFI